MRRQKPVPLVERETEDIRKALAAYFDVDPEDVRVTKAKLAGGRQVAYIRVVWPEPAWRTQEKRRD